MSNLYSMIRRPREISQRAGTGTIASSVKDLPPLTAILPEQIAPVVRKTKRGREVTMMRWGLPSPDFARKNRETATSVTTVHNTKSPYWRRWLADEFRCVVPVSSFCNLDVRGENKPTWFALSEDRPLAFFAGIWTEWSPVREPREGAARYARYGFLTTKTSGPVKPGFPKVLPVILTKASEIEGWLTLPATEALKLQRPLPDGALQIVATGEREDP